jgi:hypothetical protein
MQRVLANFDATKEPHGGKCGTCHDPHAHETVAEAAQTCATAACHGNWREEPFHVGAAHRRVAPRCLTCHAPHSARVDASDCAGCHANARERGNPRPPVPFDTTRALRRTSLVPGGTTPADAPSPFMGHMPVPNVRPEPPRIPGAHSAVPARDDGAGLIDDAADAGESSGGTTIVPGAPEAALAVPWPPPTAADSFSHARHTKLACLVCHQTGTGHGRLTFQPPRGCMICHHQAPATARCESCHQAEEVAPPKPVTVTVRVPAQQPRPRPVDFLHLKHPVQTCVECHKTPVKMGSAHDLFQFS